MGYICKGPREFINNDGVRVEYFEIFFVMPDGSLELMDSFTHLYHAFRFINYLNGGTGEIFVKN